MESRVLFCLILASFFLSGVQSATFTFKNNCPYTVWPAALSGSGSALLSSTGFELASGASSPLDVPAPWSGHFWARTQCSNDASGKFVCATADCASSQVACNGAGGIPPVTLAEFTIKASGNGEDFYDVSLVDGFNLPLSITPQGGNGGCSAASCPANVNKVCPPELAIRGTDGSIIACKSACEALNTPETCCSGEFGTPDKCRPSTYAQLFKSQCPQAYSYAYDDLTSTFTCTGANYLITFCP